MISSCLSPTNIANFWRWGGGSSRAFTPIIGRWFARHFTESKKASKFWTVKTEIKTEFRQISLLFCSISTRCFFFVKTAVEEGYSHGIKLIRKYLRKKGQNLNLFCMWRGCVYSVRWLNRQLEAFLTVRSVISLSSFDWTREKTVDFDSELRRSFDHWTKTCPDWSRARGYYSI